MRGSGNGGTFRWLNVRHRVKNCLTYRGQIDVPPSPTFSRFISTGSGNALPSFPGCPAPLLIFQGKQAFLYERGWRQFSSRHWGGKGNSLTPLDPTHVPEVWLA